MEQPQPAWNDIVYARVDIDAIIGSPWALRAWAELTEALKSSMPTAICVSTCSGEAIIWRPKSVEEKAADEAAREQGAKASEAWNAKYRAERTRLAESLGMSVDELAAHEKAAKEAAKEAVTKTVEVATDAGTIKE